MTLTLHLQNTHNIDAHVHALGQKYMGLRPNMHREMFQDTSIKPNAGHDVLVDNFLNAQCMFPSVFLLLSISYGLYFPAGSTVDKDSD